MATLGPAALFLTEQPPSHERGRQEVPQKSLLEYSVLLFKSPEECPLNFWQRRQNILSGGEGKIAHLTNGAKKTGFLICRKWNEIVAFSLYRILKWITSLTTLKLLEENTRYWHRRSLFPGTPAAQEPGLAGGLRENHPFGTAEEEWAALTDGQGSLLSYTQARSKQPRYKQPQGIKYQGEKLPMVNGPWTECIVFTKTSQ